VDIAEGKEVVESFVQEQGLTFTILLDEEANAARAYQVRGIPRSFFIDRDGVIRASHAGPVDDALVEQALGLLLR
jgi:peroxiredoxin